MPNPVRSVVVRAQERTRQLVDQAVASHARVWVKIIPPAPDSRTPQLAQFRENAARALYSCGYLHITEIYMKEYRWRWSDARMAYERIAGYYDKVAELLLLSETVSRLPRVRLHHDPRFKDQPPLSPPPDIVAFALLSELLPLGLPAELGVVAKEEQVAKAAGHFRALADAARAYAKDCIDIGGDWKKYSAFDALVCELKCAFEFDGQTAMISRSRGRRPDARGWQGKYFDLVEAVWPVARTIAEQATSQPLRGPGTPKARGAYLERLLKKGG